MSFNLKDYYCEQWLGIVPVIYLGMFPRGLGATEQTKVCGQAMCRVVGRARHPRSTFVVLRANWWN